MARPKNDLDRLFDKYLPDVDREDANRCWIWQGSPHKPKPYVTKNPRRGHVIIRDPKPQPKVRWDGSLIQPNRLLYQIFVGPLAPAQRLTSKCGCVNPWHQEATSQPATYYVPPFGDLATFIEEVIQPHPPFDYETFFETWEDELQHIPRDVIHEEISRFQGRGPG